ncbi:hypothetical protein FF011L_21120 [Roseimaritima multifibrata]|uniref:Lipoprotein n=1 Tax=Roseimaritima multifibrata TaxID=1930274 RepID=A0A517MEQ0_9BACT|nr:hypothetical protein [Roseimaritima multifibrata]QDS93349.1 hypothetical protein FF011L_21120 [Roseimaritima multifibrata]
MKIQNFRAALLLAICVSVGLSGCSVIKGEKTFRESLPLIGKKKEEEPYPNPQKLAVTWSPDVILRTGATPTRGFGGRVFFYDEKTRPVPVEGELAIQAIRTVDGEQPELKRYAFTSEQFTSHYSQTDLGASYSIWIPWDAVGGSETKITLIPSFKSKTGEVLQGTSSVVMLPGKTEREETAFDLPPLDKMAAQGSYAGGAWSLGNLANSSRGGLTTTTIPVRGSLPRGMPVRPPVPTSVPGAVSAEELLAKLKASAGENGNGFATQAAGVQPTGPDGIATQETPAVTPASAQMPMSPARTPSFQLPEHPNQRSQR